MEFYIFYNKLVYRGMGNFASSLDFDSQEVTTKPDPMRGSPAPRGAQLYRRKLTDI